MPDRPENNQCADTEIRLGFKSRTGQFTYPFLISFMLLVHRYVYAAYPEWRTAEVYLSIGLVGLYIFTRKTIIGETRARW